MSRRSLNVRLYLRLFKTRDDCFALQRRDGMYTPMDTEFQAHHARDHLDGEYTYGQYLVDPTDDTVIFAVIDNDIDEEGEYGLQPALRAAQEQRANAISRYGFRSEQVWLEYSGRRGYHVWVFFDQPTPANDAIAVMRGIRGIGEHKVEIEHDGEDVGHVEIYPKQSSVNGGGYGNLVKMPLGYHQKTGNRMEFVRPSGTVYDDQASVLASISRHRVKIETVARTAHTVRQEIEENEDEAPIADSTDGELAFSSERDYDVRRCIRRTFDGRFASPSHQLRLAAATELLGNGYSVGEIVELFSVFADFDEEITRKKIDGINANGHSPWRCTTMQSKCPEHANGLCDDCPYQQMDMIKSMDLNRARRAARQREKAE